MAKRHRTRPRQRHAVEAAHRPATPRAEREANPSVRGTHRAARTGRSGYSRAVGAPSGALDRSAVLERSFVVKDFRRLGMVVAVALGLLVAAGAIESLLLGR